MEITTSYERFPGWIIIVSSLFSILVYLSGLIITLNVHFVAGAVYMAFILAFEYRLLSRHCTRCYYWGKSCGFGKGMVSSWLFRKEDPSRFCEKEMTWKDMIPDLLIALVPFITGIVLLIISFKAIILAAVLLLVILTTAGNGLIRGSLTCRFCKQRELGCPADKLFNKKHEQNPKTTISEI